MWLGQHLSERLELKWPNDLLLGGNKVAGVLVQQCQSGAQTWVVAGVGVNLRWNEPPPDGISAAGLIQSLMTIRREEVLECLLEAIRQLSSQPVIDAEEMAARFNAVHRYHHMSVEFIDKGERGLQLEGRVQGVSPRGGLVLELPGRGVHEYSLGALSMREAKPA
jgi:biotin-(acetyl-CoA carboxylase) ligase